MTKHFEQYCKGATSLPPQEQKHCLEKFVASECFKLQLDQVRAQSLERLVINSFWSTTTNIG
ncbi:unnamed protein product [Haemonchus placei]|uniref:COX assembly mitochondrial protein n=1 Tax=Haemonchus placei TaxID=6290 RepID=A0A3P7VIS0_HAEPC|nr:unnamed protein product [Haemonchus placei]